MATTHSHTLISATFHSHATFRLLSHRFPSLVIKCSNRPNIGDMESSNLLENGLKAGTQTVEPELDKNGNKLFEIARLRKKPLEERPTMEEAVHDAMVYKNKEKLESVKAAVISAIIGTLVSLPMSLTHVTSNYELTVSTAITISTCALYGGTFRYAVRRDLDDFHLKTGTSAAFGIVKGLATLDGRPSLDQEAGGLLSDALNGVVIISENVLIFLFAAAGLDICYKMGILSPFPVERSVSRTKQ